MCEFVACCLWVC